jgi:cobyrinic acid a,c-diamide synthase
MVKGDMKARAQRCPPRIVVAAPQGRSGKTIVSLGLCAAFTQRGLAVQPFKKGPDYIDSSWLAAAARRDCRNLDGILMTEGVILSSFQQACRGADLAVIEGAMGLYDGFDCGKRGSTAQIARMLQSPIILVVNATRMTQSVAALVSGYQHFEPDTDIAGVILNNVSGSRHEHKLVAAVEQHCGIPVVGSIPRDPDLGITQRHLGLVPYREAGESAVINNIYRRLEGNIDLVRILDIARSAGTSYTGDIATPEKKATVAKLGVVFDGVFNFYYPENLEALTRAGAELVLIDSTQDRELPDIDGLYIGGGFPELFLKELEANRPLRQDIARAIEDYLPVYAECAGLMYLCRGIRWQNHSYDMVGTIPADVEIYPQPQGHGYTQVTTTGDNPLFPAGLTFWGHEFHYSRLQKSDDLNYAYQLQRGQGIDGKHDGITYKNVFAAYTHLHALTVPTWAEAMVSAAVRDGRSRRSLSASTR